MKRLYFALTAVVIVFCIVFYGTLTVKNSSGEMLDLFDKIETSAKNDDTETAVQLCDKAEKKWVEYEKKLTFFVNHAEICEIGTGIAAMKPLVRYNEKAEFFSTLESTRVQLIHLASMENINNK